MKKLYLFLIVLMTISFHVVAQEVPEIPNGDFEESEGNYIKDWDLTSGAAQVREFLNLTGSSGTLTIEPQSGSRFITLTNAPGSLGMIKAEFELNSRPEGFAFYVGYLCQVLGEKFGFGLIFTKENDHGGRDTILSAGGMLPSSDGQMIPWMKVSGPLTPFYQNDEIPDRAMIYFITDVAYNSHGQVIASPYTVLVLDNVHFTSNTSSMFEGFSTTNIEDLKVYPNPAVQSTTFQFELLAQSNVTIQLFDINGKRIDLIEGINGKKGVNEYKYDLGDVNRGIYIYSIKTPYGIMNGKLIVK